MAPSILVFAARPADRQLAGRTLRSLQGKGLAPRDAAELAPGEIAATLAAAPAWLVRAGAWPIASPPIPFPPASATGLPLVALGSIREGDPGEVAAWSALLAATGGDLSHLPALPPVASAYVDATAASRLAERVAAGETVAAALSGLLDPAKARLVRYAPLDVGDDPALRVVLAVTSLQQGGAERMVLDLAEELPAGGAVRPFVAAIGKPTRAAFPAPPGAADLSGAGKREARVEALGRFALGRAADLIHAHLLTRDDLARLAVHGVPVAVTVHNTREGWPAGLAEIGREHAALLVACSLAVEADLRAAVQVPARTVWNGIDASRLRPSAELRARGAELRRRLEIGPSDVVLLAVANPRPQKRLHLLPEVLAEVRRELARRGIPREARLVVAGDARPTTGPAVESARELHDAIARFGVEPHVRLPGSLDDIAPALAAADVLVSASAHEGLSLAHLEALAAGVPMAATDAGGTREIAPDHPALALLPLDAPPARIAAAAVDLALQRPAGARAIVEADFTRRRMAERYAALYPRAVQAARSAESGRRGLCLILNNLSTGGAQSSARRLLLALAAEGMPVRAAVIEEQPDYPTPGRRALQAAGIPVFAVPPPGELAPAAAVARLAGWIDEAAPRAVLFWNALTHHKILLADALIDVPVFDVSPGEMYFTSLARHLEKPRPGLPYRDARAYGARLAGVIVKYAAEAPRAAEVLGAPVHVVPNGVPLGDRPAARPPRSGPVILGTAARLSPQKNLEALLAALRRAAPRMPPHVLRVAGTAERGGEAYAAGLRAASEGLAVEWLGDVDGTDAFLRDLDAFVMISEPAGCPNASLEAMAAGLPVVATDVGGASEQVVDGVTGRLLPRGDEEALASALLEISRDAALRRRMGEAGRARVEERFALARMVEDYRRVSGLDV